PRSRRNIGMTEKGSSHRHKAMVTETTAYKQGVKYATSPLACRWHRLLPALRACNRTGRQSNRVGFDAAGAGGTDPRPTARGRQAAGAAAWATPARHPTARPA